MAGAFDKRRFAIPCIHLGDLTGEARDCIACGGKKQVPINQCALYGHCTTAENGRLIYNEDTDDPLIKNTIEVPCCLTCKDYQPSKVLEEALGQALNQQAAGLMGLFTKLGAQVSVSEPITGPFPGVWIERPGQAREYIIPPASAQIQELDLSRVNPKTGSCSCCGGGGIITSCCPGVSINRTLTVTLSGAFTGTFTLAYQGGTSFNWAGPWSVCGGTTTVSIACPNLGILSQFQMSMTGSFVANSYSVTTQCSPFKLTITVSGQCGGIGTVYNFTMTIQ